MQAHRKAAFGAVAGALTLILALSLFFGLNGRVYAVNIDGKTVGYVEQPADVDGLVAEIKADVQKKYGPDAKLILDIGYEEAKKRNRQPVDMAELRAKIMQGLKVEIKAVQVVIDGAPVVTLRDEAEGNAVIEGVKQHFIDKSGNSEVESATFDKKVELETVYVAPEEVSGVEPAVAKILNGTDEVKAHSVSKGESLWTIASNNRMSVDDIKKANPQLKSETLQIGQELSLVVPKPYVNVTVTERVTYQQAVPFSTTYVKDDSLWTFQQKVKQRGVYGAKEVTARVTKVNGVETGREILGEKVIKQPEAQVVARGTKNAPSRGSGRFTWPVSGRITSPFGRRGREMHTGVDIAGAAGDPIKAADSGTVTFSGWSGGYGRLVVIDHGNGFTTYYAHNQSISVETGDTVDKGQVIAKRGSSGRSTGSHLHFEIRKNDIPLNPLDYFK